MDHGPVAPCPGVLEALDFTLLLEHLLKALARVIWLETVFFQIAGQQVLEAAVSQHLDQVGISQQDLPLGRSAVNPYWSVVKQVSIVLTLPEWLSQHGPKCSR